MDHGRFRTRRFPPSARGQTLIMTAAMRQPSARTITVGRVRRTWNWPLAARPIGNSRSRRTTPTPSPPGGRRRPRPAIGPAKPPFKSSQAATSSLQPISIKPPAATNGMTSPPCNSPRRMRRMSGSPRRKASALPTPCMCVPHPATTMVNRPPPCDCSPWTASYSKGISQPSCHRSLVPSRFFQIICR